MAQGKAATGRAKPAATPRGRGRGRGRGKAAANRGDTSTELGETLIDDNVTAADIYHNPDLLEARSTSSATVSVRDEEPERLPSEQAGEREDEAQTSPTVQQSIETPQTHSPPQSHPEPPPSKSSGWTAVNTSENAADPDAPLDTTPIASSSAANSANSSSSAPGPAAAPVSRLSALRAQSSVPPSRASSPMMSSSMRGKKVLAHKPFFKGRRNKEDRDARMAEVLAQERLKKRQQDEAESAAASAALRRAGWMSRGDRGGGGRGRGRGRGGFMGDRGPSGGVSGPFSAGVVRESRHYVQRGRTDEHSKVKKEGDGEGGVGGGSSSKHTEDGGYISSDPDDIHQGRRFNVDAINRIIDSDDEKIPSSSSRAKRRDTNYIPVRLARSEHKERVMGINTEASSASAAELRKQADVKGEPTAGPARAPSRKGKGKKSEDVEIVESRSFKGVWQDDEDNVPAVKREPPEDDNEAILIDDAVPAPEDLVIKSPPGSPSQKRKPRSKSSFSHRYLDKPALQTKEDREEWARRLDDRRTLHEELGHVEEDAQADNDEKADRVYLFQLPPILPSLNLATGTKKGKHVKFDTDPPQEEPTNDAPPEPKPRPTKKSTQPGSSAEEPVEVSDQPQGPVEDLHKPTLTSGFAGKLRIHKSGRATLNWGGTSFEMKMGMDYKFLQDVMMIRTDPPKPEEDEDPDEKKDFAMGGSAMSMGQVRGKFVVKPDLNEILW